MKKFLSLTLATLMLLCLCACGEKEPEFPETNLQMGFARACITPQRSVPLAGYGASANRMSTEVADDLYLNCIAMTDGTTTALLFSQDLLDTTATLVPTLRSELSKALLIPGDNIFFSSIATYSAPDMKAEHDNTTKYLEFFTTAALQCAKDAMADLAPVAMYSGTTEVTGLSFIHQYTMSDGTVEDGYYGFFEGKEITGHPTEPDQSMRLVRAVRQDKPDILLLNWQCRATLNGSALSTLISSDFVGHLRNKIEADTGMHCIYFSGALGDISPTSLIESENHGLTARAFGEKVAEFAVNALDDLSPLVGEDTVGAFKSDYNCPVNHEDEDKIDLAKQVTAERKKSGDEAADKLAKELGFRSVYQAASIVSRPKRKDTEKFEVSALRFGELGFLMTPGQLYSAIGEKTMEESPTDFAFLLCQANARWYTIPSKEAFDYGGYDADTSYFARGSGERIGQLVNELLLMTTSGE